MQWMEKVSGFDVGAHGAVVAFGLSSKRDIIPVASVVAAGRFMDVQPSLRSVRFLLRDEEHIEALRVQEGLHPSEGTMETAGGIEVRAGFTAD